MGPQNYGAADFKAGQKGFYPAVSAFISGISGPSKTERARGIMTDNREEGLDERRRRLAAELAQRGIADKDEERNEIRAEETRKGYGMAMKISSEFISAVIVGAILGYLFDHFVGTSPWGMIVMLLLGFCAGVLNVMRTVGVVATPNPVERKMDLENKGDDR